MMDGGVILSQGQGTEDFYFHNNVIEITNFTTDEMTNYD